MEDQLAIIRNAYDHSVDQYFAGIEDEDVLPEEFKHSARYKRFKKLLQGQDSGSGDTKIRDYLKPQPGMKFLDVGSCANLIMGKHTDWPSDYYGIDISPKLIEATRNFVKRTKMHNIGGLFVTEVADMPFDDHFFDICAVIGVLEYFDITYIHEALKELHRVMKPQGKVVMDFPNFAHPDCGTMIELENYLGRTRTNVPTIETFEEELQSFFVLEQRNAHYSDDNADMPVMKTYFLFSRPAAGEVIE